MKQAFAATGAADIRVLSNSWGGSEFSQALLDEVIATNAADMLFVAGAGNNGFDNDILPMYPASFNAPNVISVAATSNTDDRAWFSNYGAESVHLAAPGVDILSTMPGGTYSFLSGTSMATPHVSGAAALVLSACEMDTAALKETLLGTVAPLPALAGITTTGGRLQVNSALRACTLPPDTPANLTARPGDTQVLLAWNAALGAIKYNVKRSLTSGGPYITIAADVAGAAYLDADVVNGTRYYYVVSGQNTLGESGDSNEASAVPNIPPDVVVSALSAPAVAGAGTTIAVSVTTRNQGNGHADPSVTRFYLSDNSALDPADVRLSGEQLVPALPAGASSVASISIEIPDETATGRHYVIAKADDLDVLFEASETNNTRSRSVQVGPDLDVSSFTVPSEVAAGGTISVTDTVTNVGGSASPGSSTTFYLSANSSLSAEDVLLGSRVVPALAAGAANAGSKDLTIPSTTGTGSYYVIAMADGNDAILETSETNNTYSRSIKIGGDLVISALTVSSGGSSLTLSVSDTTTNDGAGAAAASVTRFYLSSNSSFDAGDTLLDGARSVPALDPGISSVGLTTITIPANDPRRRVLRHRQGRRRRRGHRDLRNEQHAGGLDFGRQRPRRLVPRRARQGRRRSHDQRDGYHLERRRPRGRRLDDAVLPVRQFDVGRRGRAAHHGRSFGTGARSRNGGHCADDADDSCGDRHRGVLRDCESGRRQCRPRGERDEQHAVARDPDRPGP